MGGVFGPSPITWSAVKKAHGRAFLTKNKEESSFSLTSHHVDLLAMLDSYKKLRAWCH
jgi:hypothetical protein